MASPQKFRSSSTSLLLNSICAEEYSSGLSRSIGLKCGVFAHIASGYLLMHLNIIKMLTTIRPSLLKPFIVLRKYCFKPTNTLNIQHGPNITQKHNG
jgi:hypothetical protein